MQAPRTYITGIDDDDEWTPNRLSCFWPINTPVNYTRLLYANDYVCARGEVYSPACQPACIPREIPLFAPRLFYKLPILLAIRFYRARRFKSVFCSIPNSKAAQDYDIFLRMVVVEYGEPWKVEEATQILHINHGEMQITLRRKSSPAISIFIVKHKR